jgi:hypothetical protein
VNDCAIVSATEWIKKSYKECSYNSQSLGKESNAEPLEAGSNLSMMITGVKVKVVKLYFISLSYLMYWLCNGKETLRCLIK